MMTNDRPDNNFIARFALICGVVITVLFIFLLSSIAGPIEIPRLRESETPPVATQVATPVPTPVSTPVPTLTAAQTSYAVPASDATGWMVLGAVLVLLSTSTTAAVAVLMVRRAMSMHARAEATELAKTLAAFRETVHQETYLAARQAAREVFWKNEVAKSAAERAQHEAANAREPAVVRNSRILHSPITSAKTDTRH